MFSFFETREKRNQRLLGLYERYLLEGDSVLPQLNAKSSHFIKAANKVFKEVVIYSSEVEPGEETNIKLELMTSLLESKVKDRFKKLFPYFKFRAMRDGWLKQLGKIKELDADRPSYFKAPSASTLHMISMIGVSVTVLAAAYEFYAASKGIVKARSVTPPRFRS